MNNIILGSKELFHDQFSKHNGEKLSLVAGSKVPQRGCAAATGSRIAVYGCLSQEMVQTIAVVTKIYTKRLGDNERMRITGKTEGLEGGGDDGDGIEQELDRRYTLNSESWTTMVYEPSSLVVTGSETKQMNVKRYLVSVTTSGNHQGCYVKMHVQRRARPQYRLKWYEIWGVDLLAMHWGACDLVQGRKRPKKVEKGPKATRSPGYV
ncbi:hypothetical protein DFH06DRAFT_1131992 [Mycena polygramma]|nr:hypothetical protein DFH06DRAFT_1131992 [Mycena polygramma]